MHFTCIGARTPTPRSATSRSSPRRCARSSRRSAAWPRPSWRPPPRQQADAGGPAWPAAPCAWAGTQLASDLSDTVSGPVFAHLVDLLDALRADEPSRVEVEKLATYLLQEQSSNDALASLLATSDDLAQLLNDEIDLVPVLRAVGGAMVPRPGAMNLIDANLALLTRLTARA